MDRQVEIFIYLWFVPVHVIGEEDIWKPFLLAAFQYFGPDLPFLHITIDHVLHPVIGHTNTIEKILDRVTDIFDGKELFNIAVIDIHIRGKCATSYTSL